ncbi:MAG: hypothetical protein OHK0031_15270 [Anaerolineales bacterium]
MASIIISRMSFLPNRHHLAALLALFALMFFSSRSAPTPFELPAKIWLQVSDYTFNASAWELESLFDKAQISALGAPRFFGAAVQHQSVLQIIELTRQMDEVQAEIDKIYADPANAADPQAASVEQRARLAELSRQYEALAPFAESILEDQVSRVVAALGLSRGGQPWPWVLYRASPLPQNLVISRRDVIEQQASILLDPNLSTEQAEEIEKRVDADFGVSSLVVPIGGVALYPTMVYRADNLSWMVSTIAHEWIHNYMQISPISKQYDDAQVRTMNETTAEIAGNEIGKLVMQIYYPELARRPALDRQLAAAPENGFAAEEFNFNAEMHTTRVHADELLAAGKIDEAEAYMEARRRFFWDNGYTIRKLNQAYFAFYGAYADTPGGAAGEDPVGPAVRELRARSASLQEFVDTIRKMSSFAELQAALEKKP